MTTPSHTSIIKQPIFILVLLVIYSPLAIDIYLPALPIMAQDFGVQDSLVQDSVTWFMISLGLGQLLAGALADRYGRKPVAILGVIIYLACAISAYFVTNINDFLLMRFGQGLGACATSVAAFASVRDSFGPEKTSRMISYLNGAICFIPALAPVFGSWLTLEFGWRSNFSFMALFAFCGLIVLHYYMAETKPQNTKRTKRLISLSHCRDILLNPTFLFHTLMCMFAMTVILVYVTSAPIYLIEGLGLTIQAFTLWFTVNAIFNITASLLAPKLMDKIGYFNALALGLGVLVFSGLAILMLQFSTSAWAYMLPVICSSIGFALVFSVAAGKALAPFGDRAGSAAALLGLLQMSGAGLFTALIQRTPLNDIEILSISMLCLTPFLILLFTNVGKRWHQSTN